VNLDLNQLEPFGQDIGFGYLDRTVRSPRKFQPQLVLNKDNNSMLRALRFELRHSSSFTFSVAFVSPRAIALLKQELVDFVGVGRIITSDYLGFNSPQAFSELLNLTQLGIDVRIHNENAFHPKGYVFHRPDGVTAILGSSNLTEGALARNHEWNLRVSASLDSDLAEQFTNLLDEELFDSSPLTQEWINTYSESYNPGIRVSPTRSRTDAPDISDAPDAIIPNAMQVEALREIELVRRQGRNRALVISATGTGKTILAALDVQQVQPERVLFVAHREQILDRAMYEFHRVLGGTAEDFGKLAGTSRQVDRRYVFATVQTLSQPEVLKLLDPTAFDYILIDEVHRAAAESFSRVLAHFRPAFMLGMTATPERTDGEDIFALFDYNVPYEIRLNSALELGMLAPFHYYGVADITFEDGVTTSEATSLSRLVASERVDHVIRAIARYGQAGVPPHGLIFCSRNEEARELSRALNDRTLHGIPLRTIALTGQDSIQDRERAIEALEAGELHYILTVDIFNEGVDIPTLNQVIMLRQTKSSIVFVQQLGRGLRNAPGKEYLVVIDFIGNYLNNFMIPIALFGDDSLNRESLRKNLIAAEELGVIAGLSSVRFDRIAQDRVLKSLATTKLDSFPNLKNAIETVRNRVGRVPDLMDFLRFESVDPIVLASRLGNYPALLRKLFHEETELTLDQSLILSVVSKELLTAKRPDELLLLRLLLDGGTARPEEIQQSLATHGVIATDSQIQSAIRSLTLEFNTASERQNYNLPGLAEVKGDGGISLTTAVTLAYRGSEEFRHHIDDVVATGLELIGRRYGPDTPFTPGRQYSRKDASRLLNWSSNMYSTIYGYKVDTATRSCPIFVTLDKSDEVSASTAYQDQIVDPHTLHWFTRSRRTLASAEVKAIVDNTVSLHVFAKQSDAEGPDYYYLGLAHSADAEQSTMPADDGSPLPVVRMNLKFDEPINAGLFDYLHTSITV
jgi:superfamily II DNA or RNA helicase/HKD family nuclease